MNEEKYKEQLIKDLENYLIDNKAEYPDFDGGYLYGIKAVLNFIKNGEPL